MIPVLKNHKKQSFSASIHIQWWHLQDDPNRVHSVSHCVWSSTGFFCVVELCTNNEKVRRHLQICIWESTCVCTGNKSQHCEINHCAWWVLRLQIQIQLDYTRWTRKRTEPPGILTNMAILGSALSFRDTDMGKTQCLPSDNSQKIGGDLRKLMLAVQGTVLK